MKVSSVLFSAVLSSTAFAQSYGYIDNFAGNSINAAFWQSVWGSYGINTWQSGNALRVYGQSQESMWGSGGVASSYSYSPNGLVTSVDLSASGYGSGWWAGMTVTDGADSITYFESESPLPRVGYTYYAAGVGYYNNYLSNQVGKQLTIDYSAGKVFMFMDGQLLGSQALAFNGNVSVQLSAAARTPEDVVDAVFTHFSLLRHLQGLPGNPPSPVLNKPRSSSSTGVGAGKQYGPLELDEFAAKVVAST